MNVMMITVYILGQMFFSFCGRNALPLLPISGKADGKKDSWFAHNSLMADLGLIGYCILSFRWSVKMGRGMER